MYIILNLRFIFQCNFILHRKRQGQNKVRHSIKEPHYPYLTEWHVGMVEGRYDDAEWMSYALSVFDTVRCGKVSLCVLGKFYFKTLFFSVIRVRTSRSYPLAWRFRHRTGRICATDRNLFDKFIGLSSGRHTKIIFRTIRSNQGKFFFGQAEHEFAHSMCFISQTMLNLIEDRLNRNVFDDVMEVAWSTMWNVTDETAVNCERFLDGQGMTYFLKCLKVKMG